MTDDACVFIVVRFESIGVIRYGIVAQQYIQQSIARVCIERIE